MPRIPHGAIVTRAQILAARDTIAASVGDIPLAFATAAPTTLQRFGFLLPELQDDPANLLPTSRATRDALVALGRAMRDRAAGAAGDSGLPAAYTYLGQFIDHDITFDVASGEPPRLLDPELEPLSAEDAQSMLQNARTATLDLDSVYGLPAVRDGERMRLGTVTPTRRPGKPFLRPAGKDDANDVPREGRSADETRDRAALIGDPRNDENTIVAQLHVAFLRAHNALVDEGRSYDEARRLLRQHYQAVVLYDFLPRIADPAIVARTVEANRVFDAMREPFAMPLEFSVAAYRFGHSLIRGRYDFNLNFNGQDTDGAVPATLPLLFTFTALSGQLGDFDTLPENWIIEWERIVDGNGTFQPARRFDPHLVEPLFALPDIQGRPPADDLPEEVKDRARLAVRNLLRGYLLRMPTGQAAVRAVNARLGDAAIPVLSPEQLLAAASGDAEMERALGEGGFLERTPLWYYVLAEAALLGEGQRLGPLGSTLVAEVLVGLVRRSDDSILRTPGWAPMLPCDGNGGGFRLRDLLRLAGVLDAPVAV